MPTPAGPDFRTLLPDSFTNIVENAYSNPDDYTCGYHYMKGSQTGVNLQPGVFAVYEINNNAKINNVLLSQSTITRVIHVTAELSSQTLVAP